MSDLVPAANPVTATALPVPPGLAGGDMLSRLRGFAAQDAVRRALPLFIGLAALGGAALAWNAISPSQQRLLYSQLDDSERASVVGALDQAAISYDIDNRTGALTVAEDDFYRARMLVAADDALAAPESGADMIDSLPMGASRMLEGERLREARERDLTLTIREIDGVESVRVHLAQGERSVFVRDTIAPTASVMLRLSRGRQLSDDQVSAVVNLVSGSVPGLAIGNVRVVDQHGQLLSDRNRGSDSDRLDMQARLEQKLRTQVAQLLTPMLGEGNFSSEIQVDLDMDQVTSARESYDKDGVVRSETQAQSQTARQAEAGGVPGVLANTPPPPTEAEARPPEGTPQATGGNSPLNEESSSARTYELGREVSVANTTPGAIRRLSVAVALSKDAMKGTKPADIEQVKQLVSAAVGANTQRGDQVTVMIRGFEQVTVEPLAFYEEAWFATLVRYGAALLAVLLVLLLGVRPMIKAMRREPTEAGDRVEGVATASGDAGSASTAIIAPMTISPAAEDGTGRSADLMQQVGLAQRIVSEKPDNAVAALRQMLHEPAPEPQAEEAQ